MIIQSGQDMDGYIFLASKQNWYPLDYINGAKFSLRDTYFQGFGRIQLDQVLGNRTKVAIFSNENPGLATGEYDETCIEVIDDGSSSSSSNTVKFTLVWTDPPSSPAARVNLVNDLDLMVVREQDQQIFLGNGLRSIIGSVTDEPDTLNNVEQLTFVGPDIVPGAKFNIIVQGSLVAQPNQPYALVVSGNVKATTGCKPWINPEDAEAMATRKKLRTLYITIFALGASNLILVPLLGLSTIYLWVQAKRRGLRFRNDDSESLSAYSIINNDSL
eukprot:GEZU01003035.1.p1 GENE.GEZU01003035.1~~GEZU01003035.1.p1  ORF type:complete len:273 (-),score=83.04 GEZU01003035.1:34-852(-)